MLQRCYVAATVARSLEFFTYFVVVAGCEDLFLDAKQL